LTYYRETVDLLPGKSKQIHLYGIPTIRPLIATRSSVTVANGYTFGLRGLTAANRFVSPGPA
jgi:hypothetical protein